MIVAAYGGQTPDQGRIQVLEFLWLRRAVKVRPGAHHKHLEFISVLSYEFRLLKVLLPEIYLLESELPSIYGGSEAISCPGGHFGRVGREDSRTVR